MNRRIHSGYLTSLVLIIIGLRPSAMAETPNAPLNTEQVVSNLVQKNFERAQALTSYEGTRIYRLENHGFAGSRDAEMVVDVKNQTPETKEIPIRSETGSKRLIEKRFKKLLQSEKKALRAKK